MVILCFIVFIEYFMVCLLLKVFSIEKIKDTWKFNFLWWARLKPFSCKKYVKITVHCNNCDDLHLAMISKIICSDALLSTLSDMGKLLMLDAVIQGTTLLKVCIPWWGHQIDTFSLLLWGNLWVTGGIPSQSPVTRSFDVFFCLCLNKCFSKQSRRRRFVTSSCLLWRHCDDIIFHCFRLTIYSQNVLFQP